MIKIIDCGSQLTQNIARRIREQEVYTEIVPYHISLEKILEGNPEGLIISGGQFSVYDNKSPSVDKEIFEQDIPVFGICYGMQLITFLSGGKVKPTHKREYGKTKVRLEKSKLFDGIDKNEIITWMSHGDIVEEIPEGFEVIAKSELHPAAIQKNNLYAVQFHPEADHTEYGRQILNNFLKICNAKKDWPRRNLVDNLINQIREQVGDEGVIGAVSGGVDSTTLAMLMRKAIGDKFLSITINNGLLRKDEEKEVCNNLKNLGLNFTYVDASDRFLKKLKGIENPDEKRKIIGREFISVFEEQAKQLKNAKYLAQGTLYPDVIESIPIYGISSKIKRHHNVGALPDDMNLELIEPFRYMFKDEVRENFSKKLLPKEIALRHPFPGPGLAVRIDGEITPYKLKIVREADAIFIEELKRRGLYYKISQAFAGLPNSKFTGVMGDEGISEYEIKLRAVVTKDFMTADIYEFKWNDLKEISNRIINEVKGVNRTSYDTSTKPPATIEWM